MPFKLKMNLELLLLVILINNANSKSLKETGWSAPSTEAVVAIEAVGNSVALGFGNSVAEHGSTSDVYGSPEVHGNLAVYTGTNTNINLNANNNQNSQVAHDASSYVSQGNFGDVSGYASDHFNAQAQGVHIDVQSGGWTATDVEGEVIQAEILSHETSISS